MMIVPQMSEPTITELAEVVRIMTDEDPGRDRRQLAVIDATGRVAAYTGAGLPAPNIISEALLDTPESSYSWAMMTRVMLPKMIEYGVATEEEVDFETLDDRLRREIQGSVKVSVGFLAFGAWASVPG